MAEKLIKSFTIGEDTGKVDYESLANKPLTAAEIATLKSIMPVYAHFTVAAADVAKINKVHIHKYACPERFDDEPEGYKVENGKLDQAIIIARDGDFGYHAIDGTGQINFTVEFKDDYKNGYVVIPVITPVDPEAVKYYSNFKSKYSTGLNCPLGTAWDYLGLVTDGIYRITKVTTDINVELHVYKESELSAHTITYNIINENNVNAVVTVYRCVDGIEKVYKYGVFDPTQPVSDQNPANGYPKEFQKVLTFESGTATDVTYDDGSGFRSNATFAEGSAALQFTVTGLPEGYKATATISGTAKTDYNKFEYSTDFGGYFGATKVANNLTVTITISDAVNVTASQPAGAYHFGEVLPTASKSADFTFEVYYNLDESNNNDNHLLLPTPESILATGTSRIASITSNGVTLTAGTDYFVDAAVDTSKWQSYKVQEEPAPADKTEYYILSDGSTVKVSEATAEQLAMRVHKYSKGISGKKATITIDHTKITGDIVITTAVPNA